MSIPASDIVTINPGVIDSGGNPLALNGVIMSQNLYLPTDAVRSFASAAAVSAFFGPSSTEYALAQIYFLGYDNKTQTPGKLFFAPYNLADRAAWLQSGSFAGVTLAQLNALTPGTLIISIDGVSFTSATINLSAAASFSAAAVLIAAAFTGTGHPGVTWDPITAAFKIQSTTAGASSTITYCTGTMKETLKFTSAAGAIISQGAALDTPATAMDNVVANTQNWCDFMTLWEPNLAAKELFAAWVNAQNQRYLYVAWDTDAAAIVNGSTASFGAVAIALEYSSVACVYNTAALAAFVLGCVASIDFTRTNARITAAFKHQSGFTPTVTDQQIAANLLENGYSFYGTYATANDDFNFLYNSNMAGQWKWIDTFVDQVYLNSQFQLALMTLLTQITSVPYNQEGYNLIRAAMQDPINQALNFGAIRNGIVLSELQKAQVNSAAGLDVASTIEAQGYYLQILDPGAQARGLRQTPVINFWYTDGGAVQKITVASIDIL